jgi:hypothetical protein
LQNVIRDFKNSHQKKLIEAIKEHPESRREWLLRKFSFTQKTGRATNYKLWKRWLSRFIGYLGKKLSNV